MACPLCYAPPLAMACSALGIKQTAEIKFGAAAVGGGAMLGAGFVLTTHPGSSPPLRLPAPAPAPAAVRGLMLVAVGIWAPIYLSVSVCHCLSL